MAINLAKYPGLASKVYAQLAREATTRGIAVAHADKVVGNTMTRTTTVAIVTKSTGNKRRGKRNASNDGRPFQDRVQRTADAYLSLGVLKLAKVDPPVRYIGGKMVCMDNPWPDYAGVLHDQRMLVMEAKSTQDERLGFNVKTGGLTVRQVKLLIAWGKAGAVSGVLWEVAAKQCGWVHWRTLERALAAGARSMLFEPGTVELVRRGEGFIEWDFASVLRG